MKWFWSLALALCPAVAGGGEAGASHELTTGDVAPEFKLPGSDGKTYSLSDFRGKKAVILAWFPKAFTGGCTAECKSFRDNGKAIRGFEAAYFTISCDTPELNTKFAESLQVDYPILSDPGCKAADAYGVRAEGKNTPRRWTFYIGADGKIIHIDKQVKTATHGEDVAQKLAELGIARRA